MACPFCNRDLEEIIETEENFWSVCDEHKTKWTTMTLGVNYRPLTVERKQLYDRNWEKLAGFASTCGHCPPLPPQIHELPIEADCHLCGHPICSACGGPIDWIERPPEREADCAQGELDRMA